MAETIVVCPKCGHSFPVTKALTDQIEALLRRQYEADAKQKEKVSQAAYEKRLEAEREKIGKLARVDFDKQLAAEKVRLERDAFTKARASVTTEIVALRKQMRASDAKLSEMQKRDAEVQQREKRVKAKEQDIQKAIAREVDAARKKTFQETSERKEKEYRTRDLQHQKIVTDMKTQLAEVKRKLEQSSQQAQGEVIELELEKLLSATFPDDDVRAIAKGKLGADIIQRVISPSGQHCGTIVWESKNTKNWSKSWLSKLRADQRREKAEIAVIVSAVLPKDMGSHFGQVSGVWVADFSVAVGLAAALRANLVDVARVTMTAQGKTERKMEVLYQYLMSTEFRQRVEAIVEAFVTLRNDLHQERQATERNWAKRGKHLDLVMQNVSGMVGDIHAITPAFQRIKRLELSSPR